MLALEACGALLIDDHGQIVAAGERDAVRRQAVGEFREIDHGEAWLLPGLVDGHIHFPQFYATAAYGRDLLGWLDRSIFPAELRFRDATFAERAAHAFVNHLTACGTTTAMVFGSQFAAANHALFDAAATAGMRLIGGMTLMDRESPEALWTSADSAYEANRELIELTAGQPLAGYALTPRFALSCSPQLMEVCRALLTDFPDCYLQTHINENLGEIAAVGACFPDAAHYLDVYDRHGLLTPKTMLAHSLHTTDPELARLAQAGCAVCHCASSNLYLGSGLFPLRRHLAHGIPVALGTDIGAGTHFSLLEELGQFSQVGQMGGAALDAAGLLFRATLSGSRALHLQDRIGNFEAGKEADFIVVRPEGYLADRLGYCDSLEDQLFVLLNLGRADHIRATYVAGRSIHPRT